MSQRTSPRKKLGENIKKLGETIKKLGENFKCQQLTEKHYARK
jgi:hypothetical protein